MGLFALGWLAYRLIVKRDLREHWDELRTGAFFMSIVAVIWWLVFK